MLLTSRKQSRDSNFITRQRRRVGDLGENVAEVFGVATFGARLHVLALEQGLFGCSHPATFPP